MKALRIIAISMLFIISGCSSLLMSKNEITTETFYAPDGSVVKKIETKIQTDDAVHYEQAANVRIERNKNTCAPNCAPGELGMMTAFWTISDITGSSFVPRGMNGNEVIASLGNNAIDKAPLAFLAWEFGKVAKKPSNVTMNGDRASYSPIEYHWTGNSGSGPYTGPYSIEGIE